MAAYYNEIDPFAAAWLRELISAGHIAPGDVDTRSIIDVRPSDLRGYTQCHFFAGIGVWSYALRRAGWPDNRPVWTGSCPCQPFSAAGKGGGFDDERHLWPHWFHLIGECGPAIVFGEQVASKHADAWIDLVQADMEAVGYAFGAVPFPSAGVGAPHIRDRTYWLADAGSGRLRGRHEHRSDVRAAGEVRREAREQWLRLDGGAAGAIDGLGDPASAGREGFANGRSDVLGSGGSPAQRTSCELTGSVALGGMENTLHAERRPQHVNRQDGCDGPHDGWQEAHGEPGTRSEVRGRPGPTNGLWRDADWLHCRDGKWRPVEPCTFPLAHGAPARVGRLRGYGNAINAEAAVAFIEAATAHEIVDLDAERLRLTGAFA